MYIKTALQKKRDNEFAVPFKQSVKTNNQPFKSKCYSLNKYEILFKLHTKSHLIVDIACHDEIT